MRDFICNIFVPCSLEPSLGLDLALTLALSLALVLSLGPDFQLTSGICVRINLLYTDLCIGTLEYKKGQSSVVGSRDHGYASSRCGISLDSRHPQCKC